MRLVSERMKKVLEGRIDVGCGWDCVPDKDLRPPIG